MQPLDSPIRRWCHDHKEMLLVVALALILIAYFIFPFLDGMILGTVFAYVGRPIRDRIRSRRRLGSIIATAVIVTPIFLVLGLGLIEIANQMVFLIQHQGEIALNLRSFLSSIAVPSLLYEMLTGGLQNITGILGPIAAGIPVFNIGRSVTLGIVNFIIAIPVCYFLLLDGESFIESLATFLPEGDMETYRKYASRIDRILSGIFLGSIYTSIVGSLLAAFVFYAFGLPRPLALASLVFIAGMVPILTAWIVIIPVTIYRYLTMGLTDALIFLITSSALIYIPSELAIRPYLVSSKSSMHPLLVMLSFFGGALVAGIGGFFLAPALMGVVVGIYQVRREEISSCQGAMERSST